MKKPSRHLRGVLQTALGVLILTPDALLVRLIRTDPWTLLFWRGLFQFVALAAYYGLRHKKDMGRRFAAIGWSGVVSALFYALANTCFVLSVRLTAAANTLVILSASPLLAALFSRLFLGERVKSRTWVAALSGLAGVVVLFVGGLGGGSTLGNLIAVGSTCLLAGNLVVIRGARAHSLVPAVALAGILLMLLTAPLVRPAVPAPRDVGLLLILGMVVIPISFGLITLGPRYLPAPEVNLLMLLETVFGSLWVWLFLGEVPPATTFVGGALVIGTVAVHSWLALRDAEPKGVPMSPVPRLPP